jgi:hypothetical protein
MVVTCRVCARVALLVMAATCSVVTAARDLPLPVAAPATPPAPARRPVHERPVTIHVQWGGGVPRAWAGSIAMVADAAQTPVPVGEWRTLCPDRDAAAMAHDERGAIAIHEPRPVPFDGVELVVDEWRGRRLRIALGPVGAARPSAVVEIDVVELLAASVQKPLDAEGNRLTVRSAPGDALAVVVEPDAATATGPISDPTIRRPGSQVRLLVRPLLLLKADHQSAIEMRLRLKSVPQGELLASQAATILARGAVRPEATAGDAGPQTLEPVSFDVALPPREGVYDVEIEAVERGGLRWSKPLAARTIQLAAIEDRPIGPRPPDEWRLVYEVDPGSPRLLERLRRLPGVGLPQVPLPELPTIPLPELPRPNLPLPKVPQMPGSVQALVPRMSGLLASGHSLVEPHALGPMLRLPPAAAPGQPSWEGIVVAGVQPGTPLAVEVEFPQDQEAVIGVTVLELDAAGTGVECRHAGGFETEAERYGTAAVGPGCHRFVFWPTTRQPLVVISNPSVRRPAVFGKVRILAGPGRLPFLDRDAPAATRPVYGFLPRPEFSRWGGFERVAQGGGRPFADWWTHLSGIRHAADLLAARRAAGAMVTVFADGAAAWPSRLTRHAPRWGGGAAEAGFAAAPRDVLDAICRVHASEGLRLVAAMSFDAPLPALDGELRREGSNGLLCVGRDGRPRPGPHGTPHYNILDPRVQRAVEEHVRELAGRLRGRPLVDGVALLLPHDGWLHLPGVTWGLDDQTFGRFLRAAGVAEQAGGAERFAVRAEMVEGSLRDLWLAWRADELAAFHRRLAGLLAEYDPGWSLYLAPTTLFVAGDLAPRFRPLLAAKPVGSDLLLEIGLDPGRSTTDSRVVYVSPQVHGAAGDTVDRALLVAMNRAAPILKAAAEARRRGVAIIEQPLDIDLRRAARHGPFGGAAADGGALHALPAGAAARRSLAESLAVADAEAVFDMRLALEAPAGVDRGRRAFATLPAGRAEPVGTGTGPVVLRGLRGTNGLVLQAVNATAAPARILLPARVASVHPADETSDATLSAVDGAAALSIDAWGIRTLVIEGGIDGKAVRVEHDERVRQTVMAGIDDLRRRRRSLETPTPLAVLDNPDFEIGADQPPRGGAIAGWELVEPRRGGLAFAPGVAAGAESGPGRCVVFSSLHGQATLRSNPFVAPAAGRLCIAVRLRVGRGDPQPPLRLALEGVIDDREYYRFAGVGGLAGGRPLTEEWARFVLPVEDLPAAGLESLRVRFDLLGPGAVQIDEVRVFDLAFEEPQRVQLSRQIADIERAAAAGDIGRCVAGLDDYWPRFLAAFAPLAEVPRVAEELKPTPPATPPQPPGLLDRVRGWWR